MHDEKKPMAGSAFVSGYWTDVRSHVVAMIERCPSGALTYAFTSGEEANEPDLAPHVGVIPDGPLFVTGGIHELRSVEGDLKCPRLSGRRTIWKPTRTAVTLPGARNMPVNERRLTELLRMSREADDLERDLESPAPMVAHGVYDFLALVYLSRQKAPPANKSQPANDKS
jgi:hypothetical protein